MRVLLVGHSGDPDLARIATMLCNANAVVDVLAVDRVGHQPGFDSRADPLRRYDVGYCRGSRPEQFIHYHFDRTLLRDADWQSIDDEHAAHAASQARTLLWNWLEQTNVNRWVNDPWMLLRAENKLTQLNLARAAGLAVPATIVTTSVGELQRFAVTCPNGIVHKSLDSPLVALRNGSGRFLYTSVVDADRIRHLPYPSLFQERLVPLAEHRVTVVGRRAFTARLARHAGEHPDWRRAADDHTKFEHHHPPDHTVAAIKDLMHRLNIEIGAVDLIETSGQIYFLEINPSAALTWLERTLGMQLCQTVTNLILSGS